MLTANVSRGFLPCVVALAAALAPGCSDDETCNSKKETKSHAKHEKQLFVRDRYFAISAEKRSRGARGLVRPPTDMWRPFRFELQFGLFSFKKRPGIGEGTFGIQLDERGPEPRRSFGMFATVVEGGLTLTVADDAAVLGTRTFPLASRIDVAVEHDGTRLLFYAREGFVNDLGGAYQLVASVTYDQQLPLNTGLAAYDIGNGAEIGFDKLRILTRGTSPVPLDAAHQVVDDIYLALYSVASAVYDVDGLGPTDSDAADAHMAEAITRFGVVHDGIEALPGSPGRTTALKEIDKALAGLAKARSALKSKGGYAGINAAENILIGKVGKAVFKAGDAILPQDLRDSFPH